jgi:hypothetical protein
MFSSNSLYCKPLNKYLFMPRIRELCVKKPRRKKIKPTKIQFVGRSGDLMLGKIFVEKYPDPINPIISICINDVLILNTLIQLVSTINIMTLQAMEQSQLLNLQPTPAILELVYRSKIKTGGMCWHRGRPRVHLQECTNKP